jgi:hypothetical protein
MRTRLSYIPISDAQEGMVLGAPLSVVYRGMLSLTFPDGHALTEENLHQLSAHFAEFMCIEQADERSDEQVAIDAAAAAHRVMEIFDGVDMSNPTMASLFDQVLVFRSA